MSLHTIGSYCRFFLQPSILCPLWFFYGRVFQNQTDVCWNTKLWITNVFLIHFLLSCNSLLLFFLFYPDSLFLWLDELRLLSGIEGQGDFERQESLVPAVKVYTHPRSSKTRAAVAPQCKGQAHQSMQWHLLWFFLWLLGLLCQAEPSSATLSLRPFLRWWGAHYLSFCY